MSIKYKLVYVDNSSSCYDDYIAVCSLGLEWRELDNDDELILLKNAVSHYNRNSFKRGKTLLVITEFDYDSGLDGLEFLIKDYKLYLNHEKKLQQKKEEEELKRKEAANAKKAEKDLEKKRKMLEKLKKELGENN